MFFELFIDKLMKNNAFSSNLWKTFKKAIKKMGIFIIYKKHGFVYLQI